MKLGYSTWGMPTVPMDVALPHLAALGYDGVEITVIPGYTANLASLTASDRRRIAQLLSDQGLALPSLASQTSLLAADPEEHRANFARLTGAVDLAVEWAQDGQPPCVDTTVGGKPQDWDRVYPLLVERLGALVSYAGERGVTIAMEPHVGSALNTIARVQQMLDAIDAPNLKVNFDISHFNVQGVPVEESVAALAPVTAHAHVKDERGIAPNHEFLIPGEGEFDYVRYLQLMRESGYNGFISPEVSVMVQRRPNYDPLAAAALTYETLARAFEEAGISR